MLRSDTENEILKQSLQNANDRIANLEQQQTIRDREQYLQNELIKIAEMKTQLYKEAYEKEKEIVAQALALVEKTEKRSTWTTIGTILLGIAATVLAFVH